LVVATAVAGIAYVARAYVAREEQKFQQAAVRRAQEDLERQLAALKAHQTSSLYFYDTRGTDALLRRTQESAEVRELFLELTDVSEVGMASVATLPQLRRLVLYGGRGITDRGLANLRGMSSLEALELKNTQVTSGGLLVLPSLPNLRSLVIFCEPRLATLDDAGLAHLKNLPKLSALSITGGWASWGAIAELQTHLPNCKLVTD
jgi:hypothetical protein